jgi:hypothetical protein
MLKARHAHKNAVCCFTRNGKVDETQTFVLANDNHRKEFLSLCVAIAQGEAEAERITIQYND